VRLEMRRLTRRFSELHWPPWILIGAWVGLSVLDISSLRALDEDWLRYLGSDQPLAHQNIEPFSKGTPIPGSGSTVVQRASSTSLDRIREASFPLRLAQELLHQPLVNTGSGSRLDFCAEFTKPDSLKIRLMGTPKNHRSPPA